MLGEVGSPRRMLSAIGSDFYFTLLSIIQGITLGTLVAKANAVVHAPAVLPVPAAVHAAGLVITGLLLIIYVWFEYVKSAATFAWPPTWLTSAMPFSVGLLESVFILSGSRPSGFLALFGALGALGALEHSDVIRTLKDSGIDGHRLARQQKYQPLLVRGFLTTSLTSWLAALALWKWPDPLLSAVLMLLPGAVLLVLNRFSVLDWVEMRSLAKLDESAADVRDAFLAASRFSIGDPMHLSGRKAAREVAQQWDQLDSRHLD